MPSRFEALKKPDGWFIFDRMTGLMVANALAIPFSGLDRARAELVQEALSIGHRAGGMSSYIAQGMICVDEDQWLLGPTCD